jgi:hypothetical protein
LSELFRLSNSESWAIVKGWSAVIDLFAQPNGHFVEIDSAPPYGYVDMSVEIDALRTLEKTAKRGRSWRGRYCKISRRGFMGLLE